jgi:HD-GYP domain-containing protein (c-di-GMP phosphodiesterase class II)
VVPRAAVRHHDRTSFAGRIGSRKRIRIAGRARRNPNAVRLAGRTRSGGGGARSRTRAAPGLHPRPRADGTNHCRDRECVVHARPGDRLHALLSRENAGPGEWAAVTAAALGAQFVGDAGISIFREYFAVGVEPRSLIRPLGWIFFVDACLAPVGFAASLAGSIWSPAYLLPVPLLLLTRLFAQERADRLSHALELSAAYRGTAFLLGDVVEADDAYTGAHSRDVVDLTLAVADHLVLDARSRQLAELTALLHDVGKIGIPDSIINKKGPLTVEERAIINMHTIEGERLLSQVGGLLTEVGRIVRSCHERYDGRGYPDGLAGDEIPVVARIVCGCDAFSAMTTPRSYRAPMSVADAQAELVRNRGTQFDPDVVDSILALTARTPPVEIVPSQIPAL